MTATRNPASAWRRCFRRAPWENAATGLIVLGVFLLMQPFSIALYGWSFPVILTGTALFTVVGKFPE
jgi:VIT1/CCC1 family predicted Fe2+/Mn2+ transporter